VLSPESKLLVVEDDPALQAAGHGSPAGPDTRCSGGQRRGSAGLAETPEVKTSRCVTDVVLPGLSGDALARKLRERRPGLRILFISGYANLRLTDEDLHALEAGFLQKPFSGAALTSRVRRLLDGKVGA
jgi:FixJ family two-component response regulator